MDCSGPAEYYEILVNEILKYIAGEAGRDGRDAVDGSKIL
jgi:hypothetical protein